MFSGRALEAMTLETAQFFLNGGSRMNGFLEGDAAKLLNELDASAAGTNEPAGRRYEERLPYRSHIPISWHDDNGERVETWVHTRDLSKDGIGFLHRGPLAPEKPVEVSLMLGGAEVRSESARLAHCHPLRDGWHLVGLKFDRP